MNTGRSNGYGTLLAMVYLVIIVVAITLVDEKSLTAG
jgi:hypothetical protein